VIVHKGTAIGLWVAAAGILIQAAAGASGYPKVPPGIPILAAAGLAVFLASGRRWASLPGVALSLFIWIGVFATPGTAYRLGHPGDIGPFIGTVVQLLGMTAAVLNGVIATVNSSRHGMSTELK